MRSLGIDIGRHSIKVAEASLHNKSYQLIRIKEYKVLNPQGTDHEPAILQALDRISKDFHTGSAKVITAVRQHFISNRKLSFPFKEKNKIQKSLAFELEDHIPISVDKTIYDSKIIRYHGASAEVVAMACVMDEIEKTIRLFNHAHIDPDIITPEISGLANLYEKWNEPPKEADKSKNQQDKLIVHLGHSRTLVGVVNQGHLVWGRNIMWGAEKIAQSISQALQIPFLKSLELLSTKAFLIFLPEQTQTGSFEEKKVSDAITSSLEPLVHSLRLTLMTSRIEYKCQVKSIELLGGGSGIKNIAPYLSQILDKKTRLVNPLEKVTESYRKKEVGHIFHMALGLAIEGLKPVGNPPINFRQMQFAKKNKTLERLWDKWGYTSQILATAYICYFIYGVGMSQLSMKLEEVSSQILVKQAGQVAGFSGTNATPSKIRNFIKINNKKMKDMETRKKIQEIHSPIELVNKISQSLPPNKKNKDYEIRKLTIRNNRVNIQGVAQSQK